MAALLSIEHFHLAHKDDDLAGDWPSYSHIQLAVYCLDRDDSECAEQEFLAANPEDREVGPFIGKLAQRYTQSSRNSAIWLWSFLDKQAQGNTEHFQEMINFRIERGEKSQLILKASESECQAAGQGREAREAL